MKSLYALALLMITVFPVLSAQAPKAPDASETGGAVVVGYYSVNSTELQAAVYRPAAPASPSPLVLVLHGNHNTCGRAYNPAPVGPDPIGLPCTRSAGGGACIEAVRLDYWLYQPQTPQTRTCPLGLTEVPSHLGYEYFARRLASQGYVVVSIDANLINNQGNGGPIGDPELILARGDLVLSHLVQLSDWNRNGGAPAGSEIAQGSLDLQHVGLVGHSRGGEAMRAAYNAYTAGGSPWPTQIVTPVTFEAIFEIGPTDFRGLNASGATWNVLLPMCDSDVANLQGVRAFDRMMADFAENQPRQKSTYTVWGANHNFFNTQWMLSDTLSIRAIPGGGDTEFFEAYPCQGASNVSLFPLAPGTATQRLTALSSIPALIRGNVGGAPNQAFNQNFNTLFALPLGITDEANVHAAYPTRTDRGYSPTANTNLIRVMEDFGGPTGTNTSGQANTAANIVINHISGGPPPAPPGSIPNHDPSLHGAYIQWGATGAGVMFQANWTAANAPGVDIRAYATLDFRVSRNADAVRNGAPTDFSIRLVGANGVMTRPVLLSAYAPVANDLRGPVGGGSLPDTNHPILQTYRIPLADFGNFTAISKQVRGVRFTFDQTAKGAIFMANVRFVQTLGSGVNAYSPTTVPAPTLLGASLAQVTTMTTYSSLIHTGQVVRIQHFSSLPSLNGDAGVEIRIYSGINFMNRNEAIMLRIGSQQFTGNRYPGSDTNNLVFSLTESQWHSVVTGESVRVQYGTQNATEYWDCGTLDKSLIVF